MERATLALVLVFNVAACAHGPRLLRKSDPEIDYTLEIDPTLDAIDVRMCFIGSVPRELVSGTDDNAFVHTAWLETAHGPQALRVSERRVSLPFATANACVRYAIDASAAGRRGHELELARVGDALVANTALLLWRPPDWQRYRKLHARIRLPAGMRASVPWPRNGEDYALDASTLAFQSFAVFGRFELVHVSVPGATLEVAILPGLPASTRANVVPWLETAARTAALATGEFPRRSAQVVVIPSPPAREPVRFGSMNRGGGASVAIFLPENAELSALRRDWVAVHEFCHLLHPFVAREDAWLSEGIATYYQEVLRARAGLIPAHEAWQRLLDGAELGADAKESLAKDSAHMFESFDFKRVYWAGAAFALMTDVELRRASGGKLSLDSVMRKLAKAAIAQSRPWTGPEVVAAIDRIAGNTIASGLMARYVTGPHFPDLRPLYRELGLLSGASVATAPEPSELASIRDAIVGATSLPAAATARAPASTLAGVSE